MEIVKEFKSPQPVIEYFNLVPFTVVKLESVNEIIVVPDKVPKLTEITSDNIIVPIVPYCRNNCNEVIQTPLFDKNIDPNMYWKWIYLVTKMMQEARIRYKNHKWYVIKENVLNVIGYKKNRQLAYLRAMDANKMFKRSKFFEVWYNFCSYDY